jgi:hypothetical protein
MRTIALRFFTPRSEDPYVTKPKITNYYNSPIYDIREENNELIFIGYLGLPVFLSEYWRSTCPYLYKQDVGNRINFNSSEGNNPYNRRNNYDIGDTYYRRH